MYIIKKRKADANHNCSVCCREILSKDLLCRCSAVYLGLQTLHADFYLGALEFTLFFEHCLPITISMYLYILGFQNLCTDVCFDDLVISLHFKRCFDFGFIVFKLFFKHCLLISTSMPLYIFNKCLPISISKLLNFVGFLIFVYRFLSQSSCTLLVFQ